MFCLRRQTCALWILCYSFLAVSACNRKLTAQELEKLLADRYNTGHYQTVTASYQCKDGEGDFEYICHARYEPTPMGIRQGVKAVTQRIGLTHVDIYGGKPGGSHHVLPPEGPVPSIEQLRATQQEAAAKYAAEVEKRSKQVVGQ